MKNYILRAEDELESAKYLYQNDFYRGTLNHCYYACVWLMRGLLAERGIFTKILDGAIAFFDEYMVKTEQVPQTIQQYIKVLVKEYQVLQKDIAGDFVPEEVLSFIENTEEFLRFVKQKEMLLERDN
ncbi:HEPN domain-containing protein [Flectobacillus major]|jgi:uncharacterized protein (UPF0332 family)|uniref:HEPN domain-containing protein n=1 Tax=Flectobacillus major TaxID=103 RepID=UPI000421741F|nr:HEPN domain-containing protein [Flectobacillus major]